MGWRHVFALGVSVFLWACESEPPQESASEQVQVEPSKRATEAAPQPEVATPESTTTANEQLAQAGSEPPPEATPKPEPPPEPESIPVGTSSENCEFPEPEEHRPETAMCEKERELPEETTQLGGSCSSHADCTAGENGRCMYAGSRRRNNRCIYDACFSDADCPNTACICSGSDLRGNRCMKGNCATNADCGENGYCSPSMGSCGNYRGVVAYYCHTCEDECTNDSDCGGSSGYCAYDETAERWMCSNSHCKG